jgi:phospholipid transport system substrate-binding protein
MHSIYCKTLLLIGIQFFLVDNLLAKSAHDYANETHQNIINIIKTEQVLFTNDPEEFTKIISSAFRPIVDFERISRNVMGKYFKEANELQRKRFSNAFESSLLSTYSKTLVEFQDEKIVVVPPENQSKRKDRAKVNIEIITATKKYSGIYSMYLDKNSQWKIVNIYIAGIDLGRTFRNQFYSLMEKNSLDYDRVIAEWETSL